MGGTCNASYRSCTASLMVAHTSWCDMHWAFQHGTAITVCKRHAEVLEDILRCLGEPRDTWVQVPLDRS